MFLVLVLDGKKTLRGVGLFARFSSLYLGFKRTQRTVFATRGEQVCFLDGIPTARYDHSIPQI